MFAGKAAAVRAPGLWESLKEALAGSHQDFTETPLNLAILLLSVPMVLEMCMESLFGVIDVFWVARLGEDAISTVGLTESLLTLVFAVAIGLSMGATAVVARRIGEKDEAGARVAAVQSIVLAVLVSLATALLGNHFAASLLGVMGASDSVIRSGSRYTGIYFGGIGSVYLLFLVNAVFRGAGDAATAMRALWIANIVNICLNPCLIFGLGPFPAMGVAGSAVGTTIGRSVGVLYGLWMLTHGNGKLVVPWRSFRLDWAVMWRVARLSFGGIFQYLVQMLSWAGIVRIVATFGSAAVAANTIAIRIIVFAIMPSWGLSNAAATLVGQNLGAHRPDRAQDAVWRCGLYNMLFLGCVGVSFVTFAGSIVGLFTSDPAVFPLAVTCLRILSCGYLSYGYGMVMAQALNGAGDTFTPTLLNFIAFWLCQIPLAYFLSFNLQMGPRGAFMAVVVGDSVLAALAIAWFRTGRWKRVTV